MSTSWGPDTSAHPQEQALGASDAAEREPASLGIDIKVLGRQLMTNEITATNRRGDVTVFNPEAIRAEVVKAHPDLSCSSQSKGSSVWVVVLRLDTPKARESKNADTHLCLLCAIDANLHKAAAGIDPGFHDISSCLLRCSDSGNGMRHLNSKHQNFSNVEIAVAKSSVKRAASSMNIETAFARQSKHARPNAEQAKVIEKMRTIKFCRMVAQSPSNLPFSFGAQPAVKGAFLAYSTESWRTVTSEVLKNFKLPGPAAVRSNLLADHANFQKFVVADFKRLRAFHYDMPFAQGMHDMWTSVTGAGFIGLSGDSKHTFSQPL